MPIDVPKQSRDQLGEILPFLFRLVGSFNMSLNNLRMSTRMQVKKRLYLKIRTVDSEVGTGGGVGISFDKMTFIVHRFSGWRTFGVEMKLFHMMLRLNEPIKLPN